jgi:hypothetical protein
MKSSRIGRRVAKLVIAATLALGVASPVGFAQYQPSPTPPAPVAPTTNTALKKCIKKAKKKFKNNKAKRKKAIKRCKRKFG